MAYAICTNVKPFLMATLSMVIISLNEKVKTYTVINNIILIMFFIMMSGFQLLKV